MNVVIGTESIEEAVKEIKATLYAMDNGSRYLRRDDLYKMEEALERILDDVLLEYYVFKCQACKRYYAVTVDNISMIKSRHCKCVVPDRDVSMPTKMEFVGIQKRRPSGCAILGKF